MFEREEIARNYWNKEWNELKKWQKMEILSYFYFKNRGFDTEFMEKCNEGFDIMVNGKRIDVKYSGGKSRGKIKGHYLERVDLQFKVRKNEKSIVKGKGKTTDFYMICFYQKRGEKMGIASYLIPYESIDYIDSLEFKRDKVPEWIKEYEISNKKLEELGFKKQEKERKVGRKIAKKKKIGIKMIQKNEVAQA